MPPMRSGKISVRISSRTSHFPDLNSLREREIGGPLKRSPIDHPPMSQNEIGGDRGRSGNSTEEVPEIETEERLAIQNEAQLAVRQTIPQAQMVVGLIRIARWQRGCRTWNRLPTKPFEAMHEGRTNGFGTVTVRPPTPGGGLWVLPRAYLGRRVAPARCVTSYRPFIRDCYSNHVHTE
jgi:hypothetical protein